MKRIVAFAALLLLASIPAFSQTQEELTNDGRNTTHKGKQYVAIQSGLGGVNASRQAALLTNIPRGGSVWVFALPD